MSLTDPEQPVPILDSGRSKEHVVQDMPAISYEGGRVSTNLPRTFLGAR
jgi:hypothetical protein